MIGHGEVEDAFLAALTPLHIDHGGMLRTLQSSSMFTLEELKTVATTRPAPLCLVMAIACEATPLRPGNHYEAAHAVTLVLAARSSRDRQTAARGEADQAGVYDLLKATRETLLGRGILGEAGSELQLVRETMLATSPSLVAWEQEWQLTVFH
ncbi:MAG: DUF1834 family protein [Magnetococcales bacterium]|nr:DUF1834 family protein [Magnetococcales bacterium]